MADKTTEEKTINTEQDKQKDKPAEVYAEIADIPAPELDETQIREAALAYARYLKQNGLTPGDITFVDPEEIGVEFKESPAAEIIEEPEAEAEPEPVEEVEEAETIEAEAPVEEEAAAEEPVEEEASEPETEPEAEVEPEEVPAEQEEQTEPVEETEPIEAEAPVEEEPAAEETAPESEEQPETPKESKKEIERRLRKEKYEKKFLENRKTPLASVINLHDRLQDGRDNVLTGMGRGIVTEAHRVGSTYQNSSRTIGIAFLAIAIIAAGILIVFDRFTVYEYAYNGKVLGYVQEQEEVTDVLELAGSKLSSNNGGAGVEFVPNQNVTFNLVDGRGKSTDDSDTAINKLIYMTDIEVEAFAVYDGSNVKAIVKSSEDADALLEETKAELSVPDSGMELVSSDFTNELDIRPVNVLLGSVQSNAKAQKQMVEGGEMETFHIVEEGETAESLAAEFGVETIDIYDEENRNAATEIEQGDKVCVRSTVDPVSVEMVESGRLKETIPYSTIKEETDEYYKGDTELKQDGVDQVQIFEGTITKVAGEITDREATAEPEIVKKGKDKIILVGTKKRPKTAPTGTFMMPIKSYVITSEFGPRWGRLHSGMDYAAPTGTPIYASDGGTVIRASFYGGYGNCIDIDHGNGRVTRYGHCSALHVSVGDLVYQGQEIGLVGSTGNSTGPHVHFEVIMNGVAQNPRNYVDP